MYFLGQVCPDRYIHISSYACSDMTFKRAEVNAMSFVDPVNISVQDQVENICVENKEDFPFFLISRLPVIIHYWVDWQL